MPSEQTLSNDETATRARWRLHPLHWPAALVATAGVVRKWLRQERSRRALETLDDHQLRDIGLSRSDVWYECSKPFWRP